jgi:hypothetical protein
MIICNQGYLCQRFGGAQFAWVGVDSYQHFMIFIMNLYFSAVAGLVGLAFGTRLCCCPN